MVRKNIRFSDDAYKYLEKEMEKTKSKSAPKTIEQIFKEHQQLKQAIIDRNSFADLIYDKFKEDLKTLKARTGHAVKNSDISLELWNGYILANDQDDYVTTDEFITPALEKATGKVTRDVAGYRQKKITKNNKKQWREDVNE